MWLRRAVAPEIDTRARKNVLTPKSLKELNIDSTPRPLALAAAIRRGRGAERGAAAGGSAPRARLGQLPLGRAVSAPVAPAGRLRAHRLAPRARSALLDQRRPHVHFLSGRGTGDPPRDPRRRARAAACRDPAADRRA